jgi:hypothetical protein
LNGDEDSDSEEGECDSSSSEDITSSSLDSDESSDVNVKATDEITFLGHLTVYFILLFILLLYLVNSR